MTDISDRTRSKVGQIDQNFGDRTRSKLKAIFNSTNKGVFFPFIMKLDLRVKETSIIWIYR
jgi:hypothetical protein